MAEIILSLAAHIRDEDYTITNIPYYVCTYVAAIVLCVYTYCNYTAIVYKIDGGNFDEWGTHKTLMS